MLLNLDKGVTNVIEVHSRAWSVEEDIILDDIAPGLGLGVVCVCVCVRVRVCVCVRACVTCLSKSLYCAINRSRRARV